MKKYFYTLGASMLALNVSGLPAVPVPAIPTQAYTTGVEGLDTGDIQVGNIQVQTDEQGDRNVQVGDIQVNTSSAGTNVQVGDVQVKTDEQGRASVRVGDLKFELENSAMPVFSFKELKQSIEQRKEELEQELASTTSQVQNVLENVNQVRLAVHALLASKDMLGGIGRQVSQIAQQMNDSVATTTSAEAKIQSRGFLARVFFGGDREAAEILDKETERNQESIAALTRLLEEGGLSAGIRTALSAQITALEEAQARLRALAEREQKLWGLFSWRF